MPVTAHIHAIGTAIPDQDIHQAFIGWARAQLADPREAKLFDRMAQRSGIARRWSILPDTTGSPIDAGGFYAGDWPTTAQRMAIYADAAPALAQRAVAALATQVPIERITHLVLASCTGFTAPGVEQVLAQRLGLSASVERLLVGYMGCYAAVAALRSARHIIRSEPDARVLVVCVELSTLHLQAETAIEPLLAMLQFGDGAAAALVTAEAKGLAIDKPFSKTLAGSADLIRWDLGDHGFAMHLSGEVPGAIATALADPAMLPVDPAKVDAWAVHAGGRSILDAVAHALALPPHALDHSRAVLESCGNMSSATLMFVLARLLAEPPPHHGLALAFGPGLAAEGFCFSGAD
ncbi:type III polyketide synthase [Sphingobium algorifonticola]|uniref:Type III polyketide synthase n=1 Tax=Sphingobium algorifonticola TaxID=2008318 RepID=A0A437JDQ7_9SPHN|nr:type III polyketide synthase [Sphingobium algorifonticola]RVT44014.1 type III polyketide synthase [Sphingobium algorifonticola]